METLDEPPVLRHRKITTKLNTNDLSIFAKMGKMAADYKAINLAQGYPDFKCFDHLLEKVKHYIDKGYNQYSPVPGVPQLRKGIATIVRTKYGNYINQDNEITITSGALQGLFVAISAFISKGDEVIIFEPAFDSYKPVVELNGGIVKAIKLNTPDFSINWEVVKKTISPKTKMIILNYPHNPTGTLLSKSDLENLKKVVRNTDILLLSDEVYEHIVFGDEVHHSLAGDPELFSRSIVLSSLGKTFHVTGWRLGYCLAPEYLTKEFRKIHQYMLFSVNTPMQHAIADIIEDQGQYQFIKELYENKKNLFTGLMSNSTFKLFPVKGTFFMLLDYSAITNEADVSFSEKLAINYGVATIPCSAFYTDGTDNRLIRICFAKGDDTLKEAASKLRAVV